MSLERILQDVETLFPGKAFLSPEEVARLLDCEVGTVKSWVKRADRCRRPPSVKVGRLTRFPKAELLVWLTREQSKSSYAAPAAVIELPVLPSTKPIVAAVTAGRPRSFGLTEVRRSPARTRRRSATQTDPVE
jgi:excisionase family DNA binding protein